MKSIVFLLLFPAVLLLFAGCNLSTMSDQEFYSATTHNEFKRFPLIKPYEVVTELNKEDWRIMLDSCLDLNTGKYVKNINWRNIQELAVNDSIIVVISNPFALNPSDTEYRGILQINANTHKATMAIDNSDVLNFSALYNSFEVSYSSGFQFYNFEDLRYDFHKNNILPEEWFDLMEKK